MLTTRNVRLDSGHYATKYYSFHNIFEVCVYNADTIVHSWFKLMKDCESYLHVYQKLIPRENNSRMIFEQIQVKKENRT